MSIKVLEKPKKQKNIWFNARCKNALIQRKIKNVCLNQTPQEANKRKYNKSRKKASYIIKYEKEPLQKM